jgi:hypothetical protein
MTEYDEYNWDDEISQITIENLTIKFDADQITCGDDEDQKKQAIHEINLVLQREPFGLGAQIISK